MARIKDLTGLTFSRLKVIDMEGLNKHFGAVWNCLCDCGKKVKVSANHLRMGTTVSCGCYSREQVAKRSTTHGLRHTREYKSYRNMLNRCNNPKHRHFKNYGGRGIKVCDSWKECFENFIRDMGPHTDLDLTLERIDVNGDYCPENCKWVYSNEQYNNLRKTVYVVTEWGRISVAEASRKSGIPETTIRSKIKRGISDSGIFNCVNTK